MVWANELRLTDFNEEGGWAAVARMNATLADLGNVNLAANMSTPGWGGLEERVQERSRETIKGIDANGTITIGGDVFNDSGDRTTVNPVGLVFNMLDGDTRGMYFVRGATDNQASDGQVLGQVGARANTDGSNTMATASSKILFENAGQSSGTAAACGFKIFTKDGTIGPGSAPTVKFAISSDGNFTGSDNNIGSISDQRLKKNI